MTVKIKNEVFYNIDELVEKLKSNRDFILYDIKCGKLKAEYYVSESDLQNYKEAETKRSETKARLEKRALEGSIAYEDRNKGMLEETSYPKGEGRKGNFRTWKL